MSHIINLEDAKKEKLLSQITDEDDDINSLLRKLANVKNLLNKSDPTIVSDPQILFQVKIAETIFKKQLLDKEVLLCGIYVANLLNATISTQPESWFATDYITEYQKNQDPEILKNGANTCLLICTVFKGRGDVKMMKTSDYLKMGPNLFHQFYSVTNKVIGQYLSRQFRTMVEVTNDCFQTL